MQALDIRKLTMPQRNGVPVNPCVHRAAPIRLPSWMLVGIPAMLLASCAAPIVTTQSAGCSSLIPDSWLQGVPAAPLPEGNTVGDWIAFGDAQTGKLDQANSRTKDAIEIQRRCEARDAAAVKRATRGFLGRIFG